MSNEISEEELSDKISFCIGKETEIHITLDADSRYLNKFHDDNGISYEYYKEQDLWIVNGDEVYESNREKDYYELWDSIRVLFKTEGYGTLCRYIPVDRVENKELLISYEKPFDYRSFTIVYDTPENKLKREKRKGI